MNQRKNEFYYRKAKKENLRSRASFKLLQAAKKHKFIKPGDVILDLGASPGGWTKAALQLVEDSGFILAVDIKDIEPFAAPNAVAIEADITEQTTIDQIQKLLPRNPDVVISDISPNVSGIWELDHARQIDLAEHSLDIARKVLRQGGSFFVKVFQGSSTQKFVEETKRSFGFVKMVKPKASRSKSAELYVLGMNYRRRR
jgi:23S rRNA (uridine2552-2'-O)-methyltransferase